MVLRILIGRNSLFYVDQIWEHHHEDFKSVVLREFMKHSEILSNSIGVKLLEVVMSRVLRFVAETAEHFVLKKPDQRTLANERVNSGDIEPSVFFLVRKQMSKDMAVVTPMVIERVGMTTSGW